MAIYKYTLIKYAKAKSTWIIAFMAFLIGGLLGGIVPWVTGFTHNDTYEKSQLIPYMTLSVVIVSSVTSFLSIFASIFSGYKAASMYKDEVESGVFLIMLSKPSPRSKIVLFKWLALQSVNFLFSMFAIASFVVFTLIFDKGNSLPGVTDTLSNHLGVIFLMSTAVLFVATLIFSSLALLISTRASMSATIGVITALGVIIPITSLIGVFTKKAEFKKIGNENLDGALTIFNMHKDEINDMLNDPIVQKIGGASVTIEAQKIYERFESFIHAYTDSTTGFSTLGVRTGEKNSYNVAWFSDINFQIGQLASIAGETVLPSSVVGNIRPDEKSAFSSTHLVEKEGSVSRSKVTSEAAAKNLLEVVYNNYIPYINFQEVIDPLYLLMQTPQVKDYLRAKTYQEAGIPENLFNGFHQATDFIKQFHADPKSYFKRILNNSEFERYILAHGLEYDLVDKNFKAKFLDTGIIDKNKYNEIVDKTMNVWKANPKNANKPQDEVDQVKEDIVVDLNKAIVAAYNDPNLIVQVKSESYGNRYMILGIYLALAFILVPTSYLIIRRQDYR